MEYGKYLASGQIKQVICNGENYDGARSCSFDWVKKLRSECVEHHVMEIGTMFIKDGKRYHIPPKQVQSKMAYKSGMNYADKAIEWKLMNQLGLEIPETELYVPHYRKNCE